MDNTGRAESVTDCANIAEAWGKRRYPASFANKLNDAETEAGETLVWIEFAVECGYLDNGSHAALRERDTTTYVHSLQQ
ncbi:MAG: four helix bundle protein [Nitrospirae bacterium]|nr:MAG: four helix bundle protein [Nitrospirota bacterium]